MKIQSLSDEKINLSLKSIKKLNSDYNQAKYGKNTQWASILEDKLRRKIAYYESELKYHSVKNNDEDTNKFTSLLNEANKVLVRIKEDFKNGFW